MRIYTDEEIGNFLLGARDRECKAKRIGTAEENRRTASYSQEDVPHLIAIIDQLRAALAARKGGGK